MPEGDTIFRAARTLDRVLTGKTVTRFESMFPALNRVDDDRPIAGRTVASVTSRGKHLLIAFSGDLVLRTHMRMNGSWHVYPAGERWRRPRRDMRVLIETADAVAVGFNIPVAEFLTTRELERHPQLSAMGPDLLARPTGTREGPYSATVDGQEVLARIRAHDRDAIGDVLLNQRVLAGIGNVFKSEILFLAGIDPFTPAGRLSDEQLSRIVDIASDQLRANVLDRMQTLSPAVGRRTTRSLDPREKLWVYGRGGSPCRRCGARILAAKTGTDARLTYWCPVCQRTTEA